jgi:hypothetical protein
VIRLCTQIEVSGITGIEITDFLLNCTDEAYRHWWPGTHLSFHTIKRVPGDVGNLVFMDEFIGDRRIRMQGVVTEVHPGKRLVWQCTKLIRWPVKLVLQLDDEGDAARLTHTIEAGFNGFGRILDPLFRLYFSRRFAESMDQHVRTEFPKLRDILRNQQ